MLKRNPILRTAVLAGMVAMAGVTGQAVISTPAYAQDDDGPRQPPPTRSSDTLSERVFRAINEIQEMMSPEDENQEPDMAGAKVALDRLNERFDSLNDFEKATLLNFYTNYYLGVDDIQSALSTFERILAIENLRPDARLRALQSLGQLHASEENYQQAITYLSQWRELSETESSTVFQILALSHYNLEEFEVAIPFLLSYMDNMRAEGREIAKNIYGLLNAMYVELEDYNNALEVTRLMSVMFDEAADWRNLGAIYGFLDDETKRIETMEIAYRKGYLASEGEFVNLAQSLAGADAPWRGIKVMEDGIEQGIVEENAQNVRRLTQMYIMASEFELAVEPAERLTEISDDGESWDYLGYIYLMNNDHESAAQALQTALDRGGLENQGEVQLTLARALVQLDRFDEALAAARRANELDVNGAGQFITFVEGSKARFDALEEQKQRAIEYYRGPA